MKHCSGKFELITPGPYRTKEKLTSFIAKSTHDQAKEYIFVELDSRYASLIIFSRCIEALKISLTEQSNDLALHWKDQLISHPFDLIDQCQRELVLHALLPVPSDKTQVE
jgi:hypothetical protein